MHQPPPRSPGYSTGLGSRSRPAESSPGLSSAGEGWEQPPMSPKVLVIRALSSGLRMAVSPLSLPLAQPHTRIQRAGGQAPRLSPLNCEARGPFRSHQGTHPLALGAPPQPSLSLVAQSTRHYCIRTAGNNPRWVRLGTRYKCRV